MTTALPSLSTMLQRSWWVLLVRGLAAIVFGVLTWMQPAASAVALLVIFGAYVLVDGALGVYGAITGKALYEGKVSMKEIVEIGD